MAKKRFKISDFINDILVASGYTKEPAVIVDCERPLQVGDRVKIRASYLAQYVGMSTFAEKVAEVVKIDVHPTKTDNVETSITACWIRFSDDSNRMFVVSSSGCQKV